MNTNEETEIKKEFQLERVILFSDAVFAIIITIMVLDIHLPEGIKEANASIAKHALIKLVPKIFAYGLSFFLVSKFWRNHLKMFSLLKDYDNKLLIYNLLYLFSVSFFPFAATLIGPGNVNIESPQFAWAGYTYVVIFLFCLISQTLLATYLINNRHKLCYDVNNLDKILKYKALRLNFYFVPVTILLMFGLNYFALAPMYAIYLMAFYGAVMTRLIKRYYPEEDNSGPILSRLFRKRNKVLKNSEMLAEQAQHNNLN